ncbi:hypothetical protein JXR01_02035 [Candidatus Kaiserbacteria bacterium]|nr:MAG: hypothetical protein JXR01_02035 [Candidatus Kaiserbacteria bacterium]
MEETPKNRPDIEELLSIKADNLQGIQEIKDSIKDTLDSLINMRSELQSEEKYLASLLDDDEDDIEHRKEVLHYIEITKFFIEEFQENLQRFVTARKDYKEMNSAIDTETRKSIN